MDFFGVVPTTKHVEDTGKGGGAVALK